MPPHSRRYLWTVVIVCACLGAATPALAQSLDAFDPRPDGPVRRIIVQPDQRILIAGDFSVLGDVEAAADARQKIARLNADGSVDGSFDPGSAIGGQAQVLAMVLQPDGKVIVGGANFANERNLVRLNSNGSLDASFTAAADDDVYALALQADGGIVVGGAFSTLSDANGSFDRAGIGRLTSTGAVDASFDPGTNGVVRALLVQGDGRILVGGTFTTLGGGGIGQTTRHNVGRLETSGALDATFNPGAGGHPSAQVRAFAVQPDGMILVGGRFTTFGGGGTGSSSRNNLARLTASGTLDAAFVPELFAPEVCTECVISIVETILVLPSRRILVGGQEVVADGSREALVEIARLHPDGDFDSLFHVPVDETVAAIAQQLDGRLVLGGEFFWEDSVVFQSYLARTYQDTPVFDELFASDSEPGASQGYSVAISDDGNTAIVGGPDDGATGAAWIWIRRVQPLEGGGVEVAWERQGAKLVGNSDFGELSFIGQGFSVGISADGNTAIVGGPGDDDNHGAAWVWVRSGGTWSQQAKLIGTGAAGSEPLQGMSVAISGDGNTVIVGGTGDNGDIGAAWVWTRSGAIWTQQGNKLVAGDAAGTFVRQGASVSLSANGSTAIIGGNADDDGVGAAWVWTRSGNVWTQQGNKLVGSDGTLNGNQGISVSLSADGNTALVGAAVDESRGSAWVWTRTAGAWSQQGPPLAGFGIFGPYFSDTVQVALSSDGNTAVVGWRGDTFDTGALWVWTRQGSSWTPRGGKIVNDEAFDFGLSVDVNADGKTIISGCGCAAWVYALPTAVTQTATNVTQTSATLNAAINANGGAVYATFEYGPTASYGRTAWANPAIGPALTAVLASAPITGLQCGTTYHFRAIAGSATTAYGDDATFTAVACAPAVTTLPVAPENIGPFSALLPAIVNPNGAETTLHFYYGLTSGNYSAFVTVGSVGAGTEPVGHQFLLTGIACATTYYYQARAVNVGGTTNGGEFSFTTRRCPPDVTTLPVPRERREPFGVVLEAVVIPQGLETSVQFDYGLTPQYGSVSATVSAGAGTAPVTVAVTVGSLSCATTYYYRARATNASGTSNGAGSSFTTSPCAPTITGITPGNARLVVAFTAGADGGAAITHYEYSLNGGDWIEANPPSPTSPVTITGLTNGTTYSVRLRAVNANYKGAPSGAGEGRASTTPAAPTISGIASGNARLEVAFTPPGDDGGMPITNYDYSLDGSTPIGRAPASIASPLVLTGLINDTVYPIRLRAVNVNGPGAWSAVFMATPRRAADESTDTFNPGANGEVTTVVVQADGKILVGGRFTRLGSGAGSVQRNNIGRLNADGSVDLAFDPGRDLENPAENFVTALAVQHDGRILVAWDGPDPLRIRRRIGRLNPDGSVDDTLTSAANGTVLALTVQSDGEILVGGSFTALGAWWGDELFQSTRHGIGRFNVDGTVDETFDPGTAGATIRALTQQPDGRILVGGSFSTVGRNGVPRSNIARLNVDGSVDLTFDPGAGGGTSPSVRSLAVVGSVIVVGGRFTQLGGGGSGTTPRFNLGVLQLSGALDTSFVPPGPIASELSPTVESVLPVGGQVLVAGQAVATIGGPRHLARLNADGSIDAAFDPNPDARVNALARQPDGKIVVGGAFTSIGGTVRPRVARLGAPVPGPFTDDPIMRGVTALKAVHIYELRAHITALRLRFRLAEVPWTDSTLTGVPMRITHIQQLRDALLQTYDAAAAQGLNVTRPVFSDNPLTAQGTPIRAAHIEELRAAVRLLEQQ